MRSLVPLRRILTGSALLACCALAHATPLSHSGKFLADDERFVLNFHLAHISDLRAYTTSWVSGGFAPVLTLFGGAGGVQQQAGSATAYSVGCSADALTGFCWDAALTVRLDAGNYTLVLTQDGNTAMGETLADGFQQDGSPFYTSRDFRGMESEDLCISADASQRSCGWALMTETTALGPVGDVPEPGSLALVGVALLALQAARRRAPR